MTGSNGLSQKISCEMLLDLTGGGVDKDETPEQAAVREVKEELDWM